ncbi:MspA family porin [Nocardia sp. NPDC052566]|uniref:MspA family porin n=1 Tax=Nocardia sp. NPDC052566 TaxID=3364330 RepID=UPI0037C99C4E
MNIKSALATIATMTGLTLAAAAPFANAGGMAPHEKTVTTPEGFSFTVGHMDQWFNPIAPLNGMPTNREVFLDNTFYGRVDGSSTGTLKAGYLFACGVDITSTVTLGAKVGLNASVTLNTGSSGDSSSSSANASIGPTFQVGAGIDLSIKPGQIQRAEVGTKEIGPGRSGSLVSKDFHLLAKDCGGPLTIRSYVSIEARSPEVTGTDVVYGDPIFL